MKKQHLLAISIVLFLIAACQNNVPDLGIAQNYFPSKSLLQKGIVNKYYTHFLPKDKKDIQTAIRYRSLEFTPQKTLLVKNYHPSMEPSFRSERSIKNNQILLLKEVSYRFKNWGGDTFQYNIIKPILRDWKGNKTDTEKLIQYSWGSRRWETQQTAIKDTMILGKPAIIFKSEDVQTNYTEQDTSITNFQNKTIYVQDLGLYYSESVSEFGKFWQELVEQIPLKKFKQLADHGRERVAFIKAEEAMDKDSNFELCGVRDHLFDYYNGGDMYGSKGGKRVVWQHIHQNLQKEKLFNESGYLTYRFIVNCKGEAGRFVTEQSDLDYQRKTFSPETVAHCYDLVKSFKAWEPTDIDGENVDAVFYFTFKLKEGQLIDILPKF